MTFFYQTLIKNQLSIYQSINSPALFMLWKLHLEILRVGCPCFLSGNSDLGSFVKT